MDTISRKDAAGLGLARFFTGRPCKHGHIAERYVTTGACIPCLRSFSQKYNAEYSSAGRVPTVRVSMQLHADDAEKVYLLADYLNKVRGLPACVRPARIDGTPWELYVRSWLTHPVNNRPTLADVRRSAVVRGIVPDEYSPGTAPFEEWAIPIRAPHFEKVLPK